MATPTRILIVRLTALGDVIHGLPVASALRSQFPDATLAWAIEGAGAALIEQHPDLDAIIRLPRRWWQSVATIRAMRRKLRSMKFDVAVDLQGLTKSALVAWLSGAPRRIGAAGDDGRELSKWFNNELVDVDAPHVVDHYLQLLKPLEVQDPDVEFRLPEQSQDARFAIRTLSQLSLAGVPFAILNPGAGWHSKRWPAVRYGLLAQHLLRRHGLRSLAVWGDSEERTLAQQIALASDGATRVAPPTTMMQLASLSRRAALFVGSDTGPMHLSVAVGTPTLSLHGTSRADWCGAYGPDNVRLQAYYQDGSARHRRAADNAAMRAITVEQVTAACDELLSRHALARAS